jgi:hypothetical protein
MAATRLEERVQSAFGLLPAAPVRFESCRSVALGGVMLLLPFLLECGLLSYRDHYSQRKGYYTFDSLMITLSFLFLLRIKTPESSKLYNPGEIGKLVGSDRIPEVKKLRGMIGELTRAGKSYDWGKDLSCRWISEEEPQLYYVDGHVQVYHGYLAELGKKHVSRQRLCLPGMMEFWINSAEGLPYFFITAPVNEKMIEMLESEIIPRLLELHTISPEQQELMDADPDYPLFTLVFDREGYSPALFKRLWKTYRIAVLTYRKHVKDEWDEGVFQEVRVNTRLGETTMQLHEKELLLDDYSMREVRRLTASGHQTSIITSNHKLTIALIASHMFGRWVQENFFRYLRQEYAFDSIIKYAVDKLDDNYMVVNREYSNITYRIKKTREKLSRFKATLYDHSQAAPQEKDNDKPTVYMKKWFSRQLELTEQIEEVNAQINSMVEKRKTIKYKIPLGEIPESSRYVQLHQESKMFQNIIKMIAYRAETALANKLMPYYSRAEDEVRSLIKAITKLSIDLMPDMDKRELSITLYPLSNNRSQKALEKIIDEVNASKTIYPGTDLIMVFKMTTI